MNIDCLKIIIAENEKTLTAYKKQLEMLEQEKKQIKDITSGDVFTYGSSKCLVIVIKTIFNEDRWNIFGIDNKVSPYSDYSEFMTMEKIIDLLKAHKATKLGNINSVVTDYIKALKS